MIYRLNIVYFDGNSLGFSRFSLINLDNRSFSLSVERCSAEDDGSYVIRVSNDQIDLSSKARVVVLHEMPAFLEPLKDIQVELGQNANFVVSASGIPRPKLTWFKSGKEISKSKKYNIDSKETKSSLTVNNVTVDDTKVVYECRAMNELGEVRTEGRIVPPGLWFIAFCVLFERFACLHEERFIRNLLYEQNISQPLIDNTICI